MIRGTQLMPLPSVRIPVAGIDCVRRRVAIEPMLPALLRCVVFLSTLAVPFVAALLT
jgi:hypothetical protein